VLLRVAPDEVFQLVEILRPAEAVEEFTPGELDLVKRAFRIAGAEINMREFLFLKIIQLVVIRNRPRLRLGWFRSKNE